MKTYRNITPMPVSFMDGNNKITLLAGETKQVSSSDVVINLLVSNQLKEVEKSEDTASTVEEIKPPPVVETDPMPVLVHKLEDMSISDKEPIQEQPAVVEEAPKSPSELDVHREEAMIASYDDNLTFEKSSVSDKTLQNNVPNEEKDSQK